ncbi:hypothetical protein [Plantactinospora sp. KBS50]|uniref:hypothetical protein n=1 Tax=Plantactinospora sp. KBS50 TaxID=2024580 RepID=UPI000BAA9C05|nr:hypothetical protein [Plantactinospora sp. KBS50]ASW56001.1 hypothetical protein CIK06_20220 [Plantactinospora sp. KBS50]
MAETGWRWADAWIFVALVIAGGAGRHRRAATSRRPEGVRLADVLYTADHLHNAIPGRAEVEAAVRRLAGADLITVSDGWFRVTPIGEQLWRTRPRGGFGTAVETVHGVLTKRHAPGSTEWALDEAEHATAVQEYAARLMIPAPRRSPEDDVRR